ncbi:MAG: hypothetical protein AB7L91_19080 [Dehalococcoidia bacterium]
MAGTYEPKSDLVKGLKALADAHLDSLLESGLPAMLRPARGYITAKYDEAIAAMDANPEATSVALREQLVIVCRAAGITGADLDALGAAGQGAA